MGKSISKLFAAELVAPQWSYYRTSGNAALYIFKAISNRFMYICMCNFNYRYYT